MWQIVAVYLPVSTGIVSWIIVNFKSIDSATVLLAGSGAITLVGVATLFKHRLRAYNKVREDYLRRIETALMMLPAEREYWGYQHVMKGAFIADESGPIPRLLRVHTIIDVYFVLFLALWIALVLIKCIGGLVA